MTPTWWVLLSNTCSIAERPYVDTEFSHSSTFRVSFLDYETVQNGYIHVLLLVPEPALLKLMLLQKKLSLHCQLYFRLNIMFRYYFPFYPIQG